MEYTDCLYIIYYGSELLFLLYDFYYLAQSNVTSILSKYDFHHNLDLCPKKVSHLIVLDKYNKKVFFIPSRISPVSNYIEWMNDKIDSI